MQLCNVYVEINGDVGDGQKKEGKMGMCEGKVLLPFTFCFHSPHGTGRPTLRVEKLSRASRLVDRKHSVLYDNEKSDSVMDVQVIYCTVPTCKTCTETLCANAAGERQMGSICLHVR